MKIPSTTTSAAALLLLLSPAVFAEKQAPPPTGTPRGFQVPAPRTFSLDNGLKVSFVSYGTMPKVTVELAVRAGNAQEAADQVWVADLTGDLMREGTKTRTALQISEAAARMEARILEVRKRGDTVGGVVRCVARNIPAGLGDPVFDKLEADLAKACLSLPAAKGFESGDGFAGTLLTGLEHNDPFVPDEEIGIATRTNRSGGIQGGISNGMPIEIAVAFKPVATVFRDQDTVDRAGHAVTLKPKGRHDPCVLPRAVPLVEAMVCLVLADHWLRWRGQVGTPPPIPLL